MQVNVTVSAPTPPGPPMVPMGVPIDTTGDGRADAVGYDTTGDGMVNHVQPMGAPPGMPMGGPPMAPPAGQQRMKAVVPPGLAAGQMMQVQTPRGLMNVPIPDGKAPGDEFEFLM